MFIKHAYDSFNELVGLLIYLRLILWFSRNWVVMSRMASLIMSRSTADITSILLSEYQPIYNHISVPVVVMSKFTNLMLWFCVLRYSVKAIVMGNRRQFLSIRHPRAKMTQQLRFQKEIYYLIYRQCLRFFSKQLQNKTVDE